MYHSSNKKFLAPAVIILSTLITGGSFAQTVSTDTTQIVTITPIAMTPAMETTSLIEAGFTEGGDALSSFLEYYATRDFQPIWADGSRETPLALISVLERAGEHGLPVERYNTVELRALMTAGNTPADIAALEIAAAQAYATYAKDMTAGMLNPKTINKEMNAEWHVPETAAVLATVADAVNKSTVYGLLPPFSAEYSILLSEKRALELLVVEDATIGLVPSGRTLRPGQTSERVLALRTRLASKGYDVGDALSEEYSDDIIAAVKAFQTDAGLNSDGLVGPKTLASINAGPAQHLKQVIVNLERLRWMNVELGERHIYVNIPDYTASVIDNGLPTLSFRVVVGKGRHQTAEFSDTMTHMIANPSWNVPTSISSKEYLPKLMADPTVLQRSNIEMRVRGSGQVVDSSMIDYSAYSTGNFPFVLRQRPGGGNALGRVKFMFPNKYNIYLHDTPSRSLFARDARAYSHGCVRVEKPLELAYTLLSLQEADPQTTFDSVLSTRRETRIDLAEAIPVHIVYRTAWADVDGEMQYRVDIYGRDKMVMDALLNAGVTLPELEG